ncbi:restriction endonuclease subunit S [Helicobacter pylori]|nr:restriction endonuclease subunit S [Helicobacter pylori]
MKWGEFKLGDLFEASNGDFDIQKRHINHRGEFVITAGLSNNGVLGQSDIKAKIFESHTITIDMFGCAFYRSFPYKMVTHARVFSLKPQFEINHKIGLFLSTLFFGYPKKFGYENMCSWAKIKNDKVILPLKPTAKTQTLEDIDFNFMENFIAELEQCRLAELEAYLKAAGLENTTLSSEEENALNVFNDKNSGGGGGNTPCGLTWQNFRLGDLFEKRTMKGYPKKDENLTENKNGYHVFGQNIKHQCPQKVLLDEKYLHRISPKKPILAYASSVGEIGLIKESFYRSGDNGAFQGLFPRFKDYNVRHLLFILSKLKNIFNDFGYATGMSDVLNLKFSLPLKPTANAQTLEDVDFPFMHTLINALTKQVIQGVVEYCGAQKEAAKKAISQETPIQKDSLF